MTSWVYITKILALCAGIPILCISLFGTIMNAIVFSTNHTYRTQPCTFFLLIAAISQSVHLFSIGLSRILALGFGTDLTIISVPWCKTREYIIQTCYGISMTCEWMATIDRFLTTSRVVNLRQFSKIKRAHRISTGVCVFWLLQGVPNFIFVNIRLVKHCVDVNS